MKTFFLEIYANGKGRANRHVSKLKLNYCFKFVDKTFKIICINFAAYLLLHIFVFRV